MRGISHCAASVAPIDSFTMPRALWPVAEAADSAPSAAAAICSACSRKLRPCAVNASPSAVRKKSDGPSEFSNAAIFRPIVGWLIRNCRAALL